MRPLSPAAIEERRPPHPVLLLNAEQAPIAYQSRARAVRAVRVPRAPTFDELFERVAVRVSDTLVRVVYVRRCP